MNKKLQQFLDEAFAPYGDFPARKDVQQELLANLTEKYEDLRAEGKSDKEAYETVIESFGDVSEIMENVAHDAKSASRGSDKPSMMDNVKNFFKMGDTRFSMTDLHGSDLAGTSLVNGNFSMSDMRGTNFDGADAEDARYKAADLTGTSFVVLTLLTPGLKAAT